MVLLLFATTVFVSAFLLFQVQPIIGKFILPWFGGAPAVWTVCMLFFQVLLLVGYGWAHFVATKVKPKWQGIVHGALILGALVVLPISPADSWKPTGDEAPALRILLMLSATVGLPFLALSATGPLLQNWLTRVREGSAPWWLYALSNAASMIALLGYPFAIEWMMGVRDQTIFWSVGYGAFALLGVMVAVVSSMAARRSGKVADVVAPVAEIEGGPAPEVPDNPEAPVTPTMGLRLMWILLAAVASTMLLAVTNQLCLDVAAVPLLWVLPLTLYLLSFVVTFSGPRAYHRGVWLVIFFVLSGLMVLMLFAGHHFALMLGGDIALWMQIAVHGCGLFAAAMICHGELFRVRPHTDHLTEFYLCVSIGGAAGGVFVGLIAPVIFQYVWEFHLALAAVPVLALLMAFIDKTSKLHRGRPLWAWGLLSCLTTCLAVGLIAHASHAIGGAVHVTRNFFGTLSVYESGRIADNRPPYRQLVHGQISHGEQILDPALSEEPTTYYIRRSGVGLALTHYAEPGRRIGVIGLGAGTLAAYARVGDTFRFYDINPDVIEIADSHFTYLQDARARGATIEVVTGDARLSMEREPEQKYDVLVLDAFSSDAIPTHLLTLECADVYRRHLAPGGALALHVSNRYLDLVLVAQALADHLQLQPMLISNGSQSQDEINKGATDRHESSSTWVILTDNQEFLNDSYIATHTSTMPPADMKVVWTDDRTNLFEVLTGD